MFSLKVPTRKSAKVALFVTLGLGVIFAVSKAYDSLAWKSGRERWVVQTFDARLRDDPDTLNSWAAEVRQEFGAKSLPYFLNNEDALCQNESLKSVGNYTVGLVRTSTTNEPLVVVSFFSGYFFYGLIFSHEPRADLSKHFEHEFGYRVRLWKGGIYTFNQTSSRFR